MFPEKYGSYVRKNNKSFKMYVKLNKALYGIMQASLLFYQKLKCDMEDYGFSINPYDPCVAKNW